MEFIKNAIEKNFVSALSIPDGEFPETRYMVTMLNDNGFYMLTHKGTKKLEQLKADTKVGVTFGDHKLDCKSVVTVKAVATVVDTDEFRAKVWHNGLMQFGFTGPEDPNLIGIVLDAKIVTYFDMDAGTYEVKSI